MSKFTPHIETADAIVAVFGTQAEVVLHDVQTEKIVHIAGNFSQREIGDPSLLQTIDFTPDARVIGPYEKTNWDGRRIRSVSIVLRDEDDEPFGLMCVNFDLSPFVQAALFLQQFSANETADQPDALFRDDWHERINLFVSNWTSARGKSIATLDRREKRLLVVALAEQGAFKPQGAIVYAGRILGLARATIYKYLQEEKEQIAK